MKLKRWKEEKDNNGRRKKEIKGGQTWKVNKKKGVSEYKFQEMKIEK